MLPSLGVDSFSYQSVDGDVPTWCQSVNGDLPSSLRLTISSKDIQTARERTQGPLSDAGTQEQPIENTCTARERTQEPLSDDATQEHLKNIETNENVVDFALSSNVA